MWIKLSEEIGQHLTRAVRANAVLARVVPVLSRRVRVTLDFDSVLQMSPSFANHLVFHIVSRFPDAFDSLIELQHAEPHIVQTLRRSLDRKLSGIELSAYQIEFA